MNRVEHVLTTQNIVGEGPVWNVKEQALYWVDIQGHTIHRLQPETGEHHVYNVGVAVGVVALKVFFRGIASRLFLKREIA